MGVPVLCLLLLALLVRLLLEGPSGAEGLHLWVSSVFVSFRLVGSGWGASHLGLAQGSFVRSFVLAGGACTLPCPCSFVTLVVVFLLVCSAGFWPPLP